MSLYHANLKVLSTENTLPACIRLAASTVLQQGYLSVKNFMEDLSDDDLHLLLDITEIISPAGSHLPDSVRNDATAKLMALTAILVTGDGAIEVSDDNADVMLMTTVTLLSLESLARKGHIQFDRSAASYSDDSTKLARFIKGL